MEKNLGSSGAVVGVAQRLAQRTSVLTRREAKSTNIRKSHKVADNIQVDLFDLQDTKANKVAGSTLPATLSSPQIDLRKSAKALKGSTLCDDDIVLYRDPASGDAKADAFPSVVGVGCTLHSPKKPPVAAAAVAVSGIPPNKRHCRSVSEPDDLFPASATSLCPISTSNAWRPANHSRVWMPIRQLRSGRRVLSAYSNASSVVDGSRSLDCSSSASCHGDPLLTPPASPVPRPASVTVIKQESGSWTFLSSQHPVPCYQQIVFSPVASPGGNVTSPASVRSTDGRMGGAWSNGGLSATKRSLSFSDDFERTESIHYTPSSTPELNRRSVNVRNARSYSGAAPKACSDWEQRISHHHESPLRCCCVKSVKAVGRVWWKVYYFSRRRRSSQANAPLWETQLKLGNGPISSFSW